MDIFNIYILYFIHFSKQLHVYLNTHNNWWAKLTRREMDIKWFPFVWETESDKCDVKHAQAPVLPSKLTW